METTGRQGQVALALGGQVVARDAFAAGARHAADLMPMIDRLCRAQGWSPASIGDVYVSVGPGAFTGMRVGVTLAKTLAFATGARLVAVPTARVLVENAPASATHAAVIVDARRGKVWAEGFERAAGAWRAWRAFGLTTLADVLGRSPRPLLLLGEGVAFHAASLDPADAGVSVSDDAQPRVEAVVDIGWALARAGEFADPDALVPAYARRPEAEEKRLGGEP